MSTHAGCFSPYMLISSTLQTIFGFEKRSDLEKQADINREHQLMMIEAKEKFQDEQKAKEYANLRAKMAVQRRYRAEEKYEQTVLQHRTAELKKYFSECLPIGQKNIQTLIDAANCYKTLGYNAQCPLNIVLLHTRQNALKYDEILDELDKNQMALGNLVFRRWCDKDVARNTAILNLHAIMSNIPTLVISPYFQGGAFHFTASMWEAQSDSKPLIRPLFSVPCPDNYIAPGQKFTEEGRKALQKQMALISTIVSGCARDSYMLLTQGCAPTLPGFLKDNPNILKSLTLPENETLCSFMVNEYKSMQDILLNPECPSNLLTREEIDILGNMALEASSKIKLLTSNSQEQ